MRTLDGNGISVCQTRETTSEPHYMKGSKESQFNGGTAKPAVKYGALDCASLFK
jgi:hypothetical protein